MSKKKFVECSWEEATHCKVGKKLLKFDVDEVCKGRESLILDEFGSRINFQWFDVLEIMLLKEAGK